jgi:hypothetical protein
MVPNEKAVTVLSQALRLQKLPRWWILGFVALVALRNADLRGNLFIPATRSNHREVVEICP